MRTFKKEMMEQLGMFPKGSTPNRYTPHYGARAAERNRHKIEAGKIPKNQILRGASR